MRSKALLFGAMSLMAAASHPTGRKETVVRANYTDSLTNQEKAKRKGLKKFKYGFDVVYALNQKTADKKARKLGYI